MPLFEMNGQKAQLTGASKALLADAEPPHGKHFPEMRAANASL